MVFKKIFYALVLLGLLGGNTLRGTLKLIYLIPPRGYEQNPHDFLAVYKPEYPWHDIGIAFIALEKALKKRGYKLILETPRIGITDAKQIIFVDFFHNLDLSLSVDENVRAMENIVKSYPKSKLVLIALEPEVVDPYNYGSNIHHHFNKIITCYDSFTGEQYCKFFYPKANFTLVKKIVPFQKKKLCTLIARYKQFIHPKELHSERLKVIHFFENLDTGEFDLYGGSGHAMWHWNQNYKNYKGPVPNSYNIRAKGKQAQAEVDKIECLKNYRFCFCYENTKDVDGYITEKIFDCFKAGCVPIYWGARNIEKYIPKGCYIKREEFATMEQLYNYIKNMSEQEYQQYIDNIKAYLKSDQVKLFSVKNFVDTLMRVIIPSR